MLRGTLLQAEEEQKQTKSSGERRRPYSDVLFKSRRHNFTRSLMGCVLRLVTRELTPDNIDMHRVM